MTSRQRSPEPSTRRERRATERAERARRPRPRSGDDRGRRSPFRSPFVLVTAAAVVGAIVLVVLANLDFGPAPRAGTELVEPPSPGAASLADGMALGHKDAPVTLEVVSDYQCPFCGRFGREYLPRLVSEFVEPGTLRIVDRPIAFLGTGNPDESIDAAVAAVCAGRQDRYWQYRDYLVWNQNGENRGAFSRDVLRDIAEAIGLDTTAWASCFQDPAVAQEVRAATQQAVAEGITSTPTFILDGQRIVGLVAYEEMAEAIRAMAADASPGAGSDSPSASVVP